MKINVNLIMKIEKKLVEIIAKLSILEVNDEYCLRIIEENNCNVSLCVGNKN
jgi:hypothetical protein